MPVRPHLRAISLALLITLTPYASYAEAPSAESAPAETPGISKIKVGDIITYQRLLYRQPETGGPISLNEVGVQDRYTLLADDGNERAFKLSNGVTSLYAKDNAWIGDILANGERNMLPPSNIYHWMPAGELKAGMRWNINHISMTPNGNAATCQRSNDYTAQASAVTQDIQIHGVLQHVKAIQIDITGTRSVIGACDHNTWLVTQRITYSSELDLIINRSFYVTDPFKNLVISDNRRDTVLSID